MLLKDCVQLAIKVSLYIIQYLQEYILHVQMFVDTLPLCAC